VSSFMQLHLKGGEYSEHEESSRQIISYADNPNQHSDNIDTSEDDENPKKTSTKEETHWLQIGVQGEVQGRWYT
jgi:hypothetical protein